MASRGESDLKSIIRATIQERSEKPPLSSESDSAENIIRVSGLASVCPREEVLCSRHNVSRPEEISADLMMIFEHGNGLHWDMQNKILPQTKTLLGRWLCGSCGAQHGGEPVWEVPLEWIEGGWNDEYVDRFENSQILRPDKCPNCLNDMSHENSLYMEQWIKVPELRLAGHPDGFLRLPGLPGLGVLEIKSINSKGAWEVRNCAKLDHVVQTQTYMWMTGCRWGKILYWDKGTNGMKGIIEHTVEYNEDQVEAISNIVRDTWEGVRGGDLPTKICASPDCKRANLCAVSDLCFSDRV